MIVGIGVEGGDVTHVFLEIYFAVRIVSSVMGKVTKVPNVLLEIMRIRETTADRRVRESAYGL